MRRLCQGFGIGVVFVLALQSCGPRNVSIFGAPLPRYVSRAEVAVQGSGSAESPNYGSHRLTVGGSYLRRVDASSPGYQMNAGLHGNPEAFR